MNRTEEFTAIAESCQRDRDRHREQFGNGAVHVHGGGGGGSVRSTSHGSVAAAARNRKESKFLTMATETNASCTTVEEAIKCLDGLISSSKLFAPQQDNVSSMTADVKLRLNTLTATVSGLKPVLSKETWLSNAHHKGHLHGVLLFLETQIGRLARRLSDTLHRHTAFLRRQQETQARFIGVPKAQLRQRKGQSVTSASAASAPPGSGAGQDLFQPSAQSAVPSSASSSLIHAQDYSYRQEAAEQVEQVIVELGGIFQRVAYVVAEQGEEIDRLSDQVLETESRVQKAQEQLLKLLASISGNKSFLLKLFAVLLVLVTVFMYFR